MTAEPRISVITPTFNRAQYLAQAIESVLAQNYVNLEHWIIDDGSTDGTETVVARYLDDPRVHYVRQGNQGQSAARNRGLSLSESDFVCFLDSDDYWLPGKLERSLAAFASNPDVGIVYGDYVFINSAGREVAVSNMRRHSGRIVAQLLRDNCVSMNTTMVRRRCFEEHGGFSEYRVADDYDLWLRFSAYYRFFYVPERLACYRMMEDQISSDKMARFESNERIIRRFLEAHGDRVTTSEARAGWCYFHTRRGRYLASRGMTLQAAGAYGRALAYGPFSRAPWRALAKLVLTGTG
ncbi:glycosyltransferase [Methylonatrum kenyense]|uniref:glycosyltransferase family 2 protein n=1 Tax=Methylonatrum kenyense TaxID=455253 RepID=UPI0020BDB9B4|nr:glycosyltransferase family 2 protein [Methylonatrum kenyense]MCK8516776.1 glycosyltransferase [Methylonatrum kenyense]